MSISVLAAAFTLGLRHGIDLDHVAAIADLTGTAPSRRRGFVDACLYAGGHAVVVLALGLLAIVAGDRIPGWADAAMGRVVGFTLVALGLYVLIGMRRHGADFRLRSRYTLVAEGLGSLRRRVLRSAPIVIDHDHPHVHGGSHVHDHLHDVGTGGAPVGPRPNATTTHAAAGAVTTAHGHPHRHVGHLPADPLARRRGATPAMIGSLHGIGAETPTQVLVLLAAAGAEGAVGGVALLGAFLAGLVGSNTAVALVASHGFAGARRNRRLYAVVVAGTALASIALGGLLLSGG